MYSKLFVTYPTNAYGYSLIGSGGIRIKIHCTVVINLTPFRIMSPRAVFYIVGQTIDRFGVINSICTFLVICQVCEKLGGACIASISVYKSCIQSLIKTTQKTKIHHNNNRPFYQYRSNYLSLKLQMLMMSRLTP